MRVTLSPRAGLLTLAWVGIVGGVGAIAYGLYGVFGWPGAAFLLGCVLVSAGAVAAAELGKQR